MTLHSYRSRWDEAKPDPQSRRLEKKVRATRTLSLPTLYVQGEADGVNPTSASESVPSKFSGPFEMVRLPGVGHFPTREAPDAVAEALLRLFKAP